MRRGESPGWEGLPAVKRRERRAPAPRLKNPLTGQSAGGYGPAMNQVEPMDEAVTVNKLAHDFKIVIQDAEQLIKATAGDLGDKLGEKAKEARDRLKASLDSAKTTCQELEEKAVAGVQAADKVIRDHPYESVGIAFGVGLLVGLLATRR